jgi:hypothetical protein
MGTIPYLELNPQEDFPPIWGDIMTGNGIATVRTSTASQNFGLPVNIHRIATKNVSNETLLQVISDLT